MIGAATRAVRKAADSSPAKNRAKPAKEKKREPLRAHKISEDAERHGRRRDKPKRRFAICVKIKDDPRAGRDRQPKKRPAKRHLHLEGPPENPPYRRKRDGKTPRFDQAPIGDYCFRRSSHECMLKLFCHLWNCKTIHLSLAVLRTKSSSV
jgi:hypothetical protein